VRPIDQVMKALLTQVPSDYPRREELSKEFDRIVEDSAFKAPEMVWMCWGELGEVLHDHFNGSPEPWVDTIGSIVNAKLDYRDYIP
jgi:hypothetical protein